MLALRLLRRHPRSSCCLVRLSRRSFGQAVSHPLDKIRNVGIIAHIDAGKTTTTERILFLTGNTSHVGEVDSGDTVMDFLPQERERGITIQSAATSLEWGDMRVNVIDTPGHVDFSVEVERAVRVLDGAVIVLDAVAGVQAQTETVWRQASRYSVPGVAFINKMDRDGADFDKALATIEKRLGVKGIAIQLPLVQEQRPGAQGMGGSTFDGLVDLLAMEVATWVPEDGGAMPKGASAKRITLVMHRRPLSQAEDGEEVVERAWRARHSMLEALAERDEAFMDTYLALLEGDRMRDLDALPLQELLGVLRRVCVRGEALPALCGASLKGKGLEPLLDAMIAFLPSPLDRPKPVARWVSKPDGDGPRRHGHGHEEKSVTIDPKDTRHLCAYAFKVVFDRQRGLLTFLRVYSGVLHAKESLYNSTRDHKERPLQLLEVRADDLCGVESVGAGHTVAAVGLKDVHTGDTLVHYKGPYHGAVLESLSVPSPVFALAVEPESSAKQAQLDEALHMLTREDPSLRVELDPESGQTLLRGLGELHLEIVVDKLRRQFNVAVETGQAYVAYREGVTSHVTGVKAVYDKQVGGKRLFAALTVSLTPAPPQELNRVPNVTLSEEATKVLSVEEQASLMGGFLDACTRGQLHGYPVSGLDVHVEAVRRDNDTTSGALRACSVQALRQAMKEAGAVVLEPVMRVEVLAPDASVGSVLSDLTVARRGAVRDLDEAGMDNKVGTKHVIHADVPLASLLGYATALRSITQGEGSFSMEFSHYSVAHQ